MYRAARRAATSSTCAACATTCSAGATPPSPRPQRPPLVLLHGWMDVAASFQFVVDALPSDRYAIALDWRGFGLTDTPAADTYWIPDYLGDLDGVLDALLAGRTDRPARPQHGRQRRDALRRPAARAHPPARQPRRLRHAAHATRTGAQALRAMARRPEDAAGAAPLSPTWRRWPRACARPTRGCVPIARPGWPGSGRATREHATPAGSNARRSRPTSAARRCSTTSTRCWRSGSSSARRCCGSKATQTDIGRWWGNRYTKAEFHERLRVVPQRRDARALAGRPHAAPRPAGSAGRAARTVFEPDD